MNKNIRHEIGERVIALTTNPDDLHQPRKKGDIVTVQNTMYCIKCGVQCINFNNNTVPNYMCDEVECNCGHSQLHNGLYWTDSEHFAKIDEDTLQSLIEQEEYELADIVHKELQLIEK